ncbi:polysaccharide pyruvyl transferase family protein [Dolichospermum sp. ST_con]|nr:polysaccharide pyruvyl transferase family protein [Dolichospermum sp. ST_con]MDD1418386.1 polysaccharide pyruvyl transferase family protein [Dolichospermum sp. ST_sed1]MDD1425520.1 polysaccharide pyruvyl transferase family protein [Dolichospermum sp. ST_sed9]MDD1432193.1 polysaccharide pyruvyl transferase family protein [Dolichospermum sp. ST_sed6]MDD1437433.1 polysaccharide pyruvyl transferase family protein [Dolichospermum sp. ST_sed10]MDD1441527.1 polysaccharide pyruvyl transferase famil
MKERDIMMKNVIFYSAKTQYQNLGDMIINREMLLQLRPYGKLIVDDKDVPEWFCKDLEINSDERSSNHGISFENLIIWYAFKAFFQKKYKIYFVIKPGHFYGELRFISLFKLFYFAIIKILGVRICRFGASIGPFTKATNFLEIFKSKLMYFYSVRDSLSKEYAHQIGIEKVVLFPDLAWLIQTPNKTVTPAKIYGKYVIFSFRNFTITNTLQNSMEYKNNLFKSLDEIVGLVCQTLSYNLVISYQVDQDRDLCQELMQKYKNACKVFLIEERIDLQSAYNLYSGAYMVFSNRLHVLMLAMLSRALPVGVLDVIGHGKITGIFDDAKLTKLLINIYSQNCVADTVSYIIDNEDTIKKEIEYCFETRKNEARNLLNAIMWDGKSI